MISLSYFCVSSFSLFLASFSYARNIVLPCLGIHCFLVPIQLPKHLIISFLHALCINLSNPSFLPPGVHVRIPSDNSDTDAQNRKKKNSLSRFVVDYSGRHFSQMYNEENKYTAPHFNWGMGRRLGANNECEIYSAKHLAKQRVCAFRVTRLALSCSWHD